MRRMKIVAISLFAMLALVSSLASAALVSWNWQLQSLPGEATTINAFGTFETADDALVPSTMLSIDGFRNGGAITGLVPINAYNNIFIYNQLVDGSTLSPVNGPGLPFDNSGILFEIDTGSSIDLANIYSDGGVLWEAHHVGLGGNQNYVYTRVTFTAGRESLTQQPTDVPEPGTLALVGIAGLSFALTRRRQLVSVS